jgi:hypothetical protein
MDSTSAAVFDVLRAGEGEEASQYVSKAFTSISLISFYCMICGII